MIRLKNGEPHVVYDIREMRMNKLKALQAHASQTGWMMQETENVLMTANQ